ncbi:hypothetical protein J3R83DRAFT_6223 [Lanmaoa asiatica]|nr:hypothetical protein J3R83DRAFT_6223 [Lanmaoa asiatica]
MTVRRADTSPHISALADTDMFSTVQPAHALRRRSSRLSRWLLDLQTSTPSDVLDLSDVDPVGTLSNPYLAYPHLSMAAVRRSLDDTDSMHDYVVVDEDIALECPPEDAPYDQVRNLGLLIDMSPDVPTIATARLCAHRYSYSPINNPTYQPLNHYDTFISRDGRYHPLQRPRHLAVLLGCLCSTGHPVATSLQAQTLHLIIHEARVSKLRYHETAKFPAILAHLRGGGDRVFWATFRPHPSQTQMHV